MAKSVDTREEFDLVFQQLTASQRHRFIFSCQHNGAAIIKECVICHIQVILQEMLLPYTKH